MIFVATSQRFTKLEPPIDGEFFRGIIQMLAVDRYCETIETKEPHLTPNHPETESECHLPDGSIR